MSTSQRKLLRNDWEMSTIERKYSVPPGSGPIPGTPPLQPSRGERGSTSEDLHAWSIYRQNLNSDFTDSALGSSEKSPLPYGNFQLRESTVHSIINHPRYGPKSALSSNMYTYLKFGLPRVFPPSRTRDGSSGYNSSDDGSPGPLKTRVLGPARARSELDIRNLHNANYLRSSQPRNSRISNSEANLLSPHGPHHYNHPEARTRRSVAGGERFRPSELRVNEHRKSLHDLRSPTRESPFPRPISEQRRASKAGSHMSVNHAKMMMPEMVRPHSVVGGQTNPMMPTYYGAASSQDALVVGAFQYPHLQVRNLNIQSKSQKDRLVVQNVTLEVRGGELLAVMATQPGEGSCLLEAISGGCYPTLGKCSGEFVINGNLINRQQLRRRVAFVRHDEQWDLELTVRQTLYLQHRLRAVKRKIIKLPLSDRISSLIEDLGLDQVSNTKLSGLTQSELRRLSVAVYLLLDMQILILDQPARGMDIFDTFFLIEYLRQWALTADMTDMSGRAVILTLQPPTYEILTMISRVIIISNGQVMYSGMTSHLLPYFASVEYPCPPFKNPSDYYLDLVTLDDLSAEAMLESSQRMTQLGELQRRRQTALSDPGPPIHLPPMHKSASVFRQVGTLFMRNAIWSQPSSFIRYLFHILLAAIISFVVGAIFWDVPGTDPQLLLGDRLGFHYTVLCVVHWPLLLLSAICYVNREKSFVLNEIRQGLYSSPVYIFTKIFCSLPGSLLMWLSYLIPSFIMSGLHYQGSNAESTTTFYIYISMCLIYFHAIQMLASAIAWLTRRTDLSLILVSLLLVFFFFFSGHPIHVNDVPGKTGNSLRMVSPTWWLTSTVFQREMQKEAFKNQNYVCKNKQRQKSDIIVQIACPTPNGTAELTYLDFVPPRLGWMTSRIEETYLILGIFWLASFLLLFFLFAIAVRLPSRPKKTLRTTNKP